MSEPVGKKHVDETQKHWLVSKGCAALRQAVEAVPIHDTVRAEWLCEMIQVVVRGERTLEEAEITLAKVWR
ncbi:hypothetical protein LCGC14_1893190 [marine sediment metagenome]|uniref:Uncharacterized protein n=1 Tax=marine sediment metagenome TaxID=412755 RepID=A0A0F9IWW9_9ZZZZ